MPTYDHEDVTVQFPDALSGISLSGLLSSRGVVHLRLCRDARGELFALTSPDYRMALTVAKGVVEFRRNEDVAWLEIGPVARSFQVRASWEPEEFQLALTADDRIAAAGAPVSVATPPTFVPSELADWARRLNLLPRAVYSSRAEFFGVVLESLRQTGRGIRDAGCHGLFWDEHRRALGGTRLRPKPERQAMARLAAFLRDQALLHGFALIGEAEADGGPVRYRAVGELASGGTVSVCLVGANAHGNALAHGITDRLPTHMEEIAADHGVYLLLWYRCQAFRYPRPDALRLMWDLTNLKPWGNIVVEALDLSLPGARSHRRHREGSHGRRPAQRGSALRLTS